MGRRDNHFVGMRGCGRLAWRAEWCAGMGGSAWRVRGYAGVGGLEWRARWCAGRGGSVWRARRRAGDDKKLYQHIRQRKKRDTDSSSLFMCPLRHFLTQ